MAEKKKRKIQPKGSCRPKHQLDFLRTRNGQKYLARIRYRQPLEECEIIKISKNSAKFVFENPQRAVTPGQSLVIYDKEEMLGGGVIVFKKRI